MCMLLHGDAHGLLPQDLLEVGGGGAHQEIGHGLPEAARFVF